MPTLEELITQREAIEKQITQLSQQERSEGLATIRQLVSRYKFTIAEVFDKSGGVKPAKGSSKAVAAKYRDQAGNQWSGRGITPKWITASGKDKSAFLITG